MKDFLLARFPFLFVYIVTRIVVEMSIRLHEYFSPGNRRDPHSADSFFNCHHRDLGSSFSISQDGTSDCDGDKSPCKIQHWLAARSPQLQSIVRIVPDLL